MKPDFLCIGAQKAATNWLYVQMGKHPQIWVPPVKELNYFNNTSSTLFKRLFSSHWLDRNWRILFNQKIRSPLVKGKIKLIKPFSWHFRYFFLPRGIDWYFKLFPGIPGKITGEFSVGYAVLGEKFFAKISELMPKVKIIYLLRNPIDRTWSQAKMNLGKHKGHDLEGLPDEKFYKYFNNPNVKSHSEYLKNLDALDKYFPPQQVFVGFFDEIKEEPMKFLKKLFRFLNLDFPRDIYSLKVKKKINVGIPREMPSRYLTYLTRMYFQQINGLYQRFNNTHTEKWLESAKQHLNQTL